MIELSTSFAWTFSSSSSFSDPAASRWISGVICSETGLV